MLFFIQLGVFVLALTWILGGARTRTLEADSLAKIASTPHVWRRMLWSAAVAASAGLILRLYGFNRSLWLDEFGTLWAVEDGLVTAVGRVLDFHGQSPFYYALLWPFVHVFGESEVILRLPSLVLGTAAALLIYKTGEELKGKSLGLIAAALIWLSPAMVEASANARPYALATFMAALMLFGFVKAARTGERRGRVLFVAGGVGLFAAHYALATAAVWLGLAYLLLPVLRRNYPLRAFSFDVGVQVLLALPLLAHFYLLWSRRQALSWLGHPDYAVVYELLGPLLIPALAGVLSPSSEQETPFMKAITRGLWVLVCGSAGSLVALAAAGTNLLDRRYLIVAILPAALLGANGLLRLRPRLAVLPSLYWLTVTAFFFSVYFIMNGSFSRAGHQDWRGAVAHLDRLIQDGADTPVLYRSGFVEDEAWVEGRGESVSFAPLRSPGRRPPSWRLIPLTYRWDDSLAQQRYLECTVAPAIEKEDRFYFLTCSNCYNETTGDYPGRLLQWVRTRFHGRFAPERLEAGRGILLIRFDRQGTAAAPAGQRQRRANRACET